MRGVAAAKFGVVQRSEKSAQHFSRKQAEESAPERTISRPLPLNIEKAVKPLFQCPIFTLDYLFEVPKDPDDVDPVELLPDDTKLPITKFTAA